MSKAITAETKRANIAHELEKEVRDLKANIGRNIWQLAKSLKTIRDEGYYHELGYETITQWLNSPDIDFAERTAYAFIDMYELYVLQHGIQEIDLFGTDYSKLYRILPIVRKNPELTDEWVEKAKNLRRVDLQREIREFKLKEKIAEVEQSGKKVSITNIIRGQAHEEIAKLNDNSVDLVVSRPPILTPQQIVAIRKDMFSGDTTLSPYTLNASFHIRWLSALYPKLAANGSIFLVGDYQTIFHLGHALQSTGFSIVRDIAWLHSSHKSVNINNLIQAHETILWARKGFQYTNTYTDYEKDIWEFDFKPSYEHPCDIPERLAKEIISVGTYKGETVLDPFASAGTVPHVASKLDRNYVAIEEDAYWHTVATERLREK